MRGRIARWNDDRGFGFIVRDDGADDLFVHISEFASGSSRPMDGDIVSFDVAQVDLGKFKAVNVHFVHKQIRWAEPVPMSAVAGICYFCLMGLYGLLYGINTWVPLGYAVLSLFAYGLFARDKQRAQDRLWRIPEQTLFFISLCGGWPGALFAQWNLRHKNRKQDFQIVFWSMVLINVVVTAYYFLPKWGVPIAQMILFTEPVPPS